jgi:hypothetical protein
MFEAGKTFRRKFRITGNFGGGASIEPPSLVWGPSVQGTFKLTYGADGESQVSLSAYRFVALTSDEKLTWTWRSYNVQLSVNVPL